ncbi:MAG: helix-turn-helix transcriptional regulator [Rhodospirillaceae bacterium]|nr:helix-turn-helix transcriptional regulator [Rhodospirillaceae bacterium]
MHIYPDRLKELRQRKEFTRAELKEKSKISERQITRIETNAAEAAGKVRERTVNQLAKALSVEPAVLTGDLPMPDAGSQARSGRGFSRQVSARLRREANLACALVGLRYGVSRATLFNAAPLLFVLLAESSFVWRRKKAEEAKEAADRLGELGLGSWEFLIAADRASNGAASELESVAQRNVFGEDLFDNDDYNEGYNPSEHNPFADYLRYLAAQVRDPGVVEMSEDIEFSGPLKNFPEFTVCGADLAEFTGGSERLDLAARFGFLPLDRIPEDLLANDAADERIAWLEEQLRELPAEQKQVFENLVHLDISLAETPAEEAGQ